MTAPAVVAVSTPRTISHAELMALPVLRYDGPIHRPATPVELVQAAREIATERVVGFDTESRPTFRKGQVHAPSLVQLATSRAVYLFQIQQIDCAVALGPVLSAPHILKVGVAPGRDLIDLRQFVPATPAGVVDLGQLAARAGFAQTGVRNLAGLLLGGRITKGARTSNWAQPHLTPSQLRYAATDAWVCRELYRRFEEQGLLNAAAAKSPTPAG